MLKVLFIGDPAQQLVELLKLSQIEISVNPKAALDVKLIKNCYCAVVDFSQVEAEAVKGLLVEVLNSQYPISVVALIRNQQYSNLAPVLTNLGITSIIAKDSCDYSSIAQLVTVEVEKCRKLRLILDDNQMFTTLCDRLPFQTAYRIVVPKSEPGKFIYLSKGVEEISGLRKEDVLADPYLLYSQIIDEDKERVTKVERDSVVSLSPYDIEVRKLTAKGETKWVHIRSVPLKQEDGTIIWDGIESDITNYKDAEARYKASEERYKAFIEQSSEGIWCFESKISIPVSLPANEQAELFFENALLVECNDAIAKMYGYKVAGDLIGKTVSEFSKETDAKDKAYLQNFVTSGYRLSDEITYAFNRQGNRRIFIDNLVGFIEDGLLVRAWGTQRDITDHFEAEEGLKQSEARFRKFAENSGDVLWIATPRMDKLVYISPAFEMIWGYPKSELYQNLSNWLRHIHPEDLERVNKVIERSRDDDTFNEEYRIIRSDGSIRWISDKRFPIRDDEGKIIWRAGIAEDVTTRHAELERRERLLTSERKARTDAERASRMKDEFLATLSHELRTPINSVLGWVQLLKRGNRSSEEMDQALETIDRNAKLQARLIDDLLDMNRIVSGKIHLEMQPVDLRTLVTNATESIKPMADAKSIDLQSETTIDPYSLILGDPGRIHQLIWNLLSNAVKFTPRGGRVTISVTKSGAKSVLSVSDTGMGIASEFLPYVFERFSQADASTTRRFGGLGLGLSIVKHIAELHGGEVSVSSEGKDKGAIFSVSLPLIEMQTSLFPELNGKQAKNHSQQFDLSGLSLLIVDDEADASSFIQQILKEYKANAIAARDVDSALDILRNSQIDGIISDIGMPDKDGFQLIQEIRNCTEKFKNIPAVALTAFARPEDRKRILLSGFQAHVPKPVDTTELLIVLCDLFGRPTNNLPNPTEGTTDKHVGSSLNLSRRVHS